MPTFAAIHSNWLVQHRPLIAMRSWCWSKTAQEADLTWWRWGGKLWVKNQLHWAFPMCLGADHIFSQEGKQAQSWASSEAVVTALSKHLYRPVSCSVQGPWGTFNCSFSTHCKSTWHQSVQWCLCLQPSFCNTSLTGAVCFSHVRDEQDQGRFKSKKKNNHKILSEINIKPYHLTDFQPP